MGSFTESASKLGESAKKFAGSFGEMGGHASNGAKGITGVAKFMGNVAGFIARIPMFFARKGLDVGAAINRNPVTGTIVGAGILTGAVYGLYKGIKRAIGYREEGNQIDQASVQDALDRERRRGTALDSHLEQAAATDMYRNQGNWANGVGGKPAATYQQDIAQQSQQPVNQTTSR